MRSAPIAAMVVIQADHSHMGYFARRPSPPLRGIVDCFWRVEDAAPSPAIETICPDGRTEIILHLGDPMRQLAGAVEVAQPRHLLVGQMDRPVAIVPSGRVSMIGARLLAGALHRLLPIPQEHLTGRIVDLDTIWHVWVRRTADRVASAPSMNAGFDLFEHALAELLPSDGNADTQQPLDAAIRRLRTSGGTASIEHIAHDAGVGRRQFERRFIERVGLPPRLYGRIVRFHRAFQWLGVESGAAIAARCGYADQAHLVREMRRFAGRTPTELASAEGLNGFLLAPDAVPHAINSGR